MAKKPTKKGAEAKSSAPTLASLKKIASDNYKSAKVERFLFRFVREHYNAQAETKVGFGASDLKEPYFELYMYLMNKYKKNLIVRCVDATSFTVELFVKE